MEDAGHVVRVAGDHHLAVVTPDSRAGDREKLAALLDELYAQGRRSSLIFVPADILTATVYALLNERGVMPGRDVELVSSNKEDHAYERMTARRHADGLLA